MLGESALLVCAGTGQLEAIGGKRGDVAVTDRQFDGFGKAIGLEGIGLRNNARFGDEACEIAGAAIGNGGFIRIEFDDGVMDAGAGERRENMFYRVNLDAAPTEGGGALGIDNKLGPSLNFGVPIEIGPSETEAGIGYGGQQVHLHPCAGMEAETGE